MSTGTRLAELLRRPHLSYEDLAPFDVTRPPLPRDVCEEVEIQIKYEGYLARQRRQAQEAKKLEDRVLPPTPTISPFAGCASRRSRSCSASVRARWGRRPAFRA